MKRLLWVLTFFSSANAYAMGEKHQDPSKPEKLIIESEELCDPKEETDMPHFY